jgi:hypothetical protein
VIAAGLFVAWAADARADRVVLRSGNDIRGVVLPDKAKAHPDRVLVQTDTGTKPIELSKDQVVKVVREASPLDEYVARRDGVGPSAEAQYEFGLWCESNKLPGPAQIHYQRAVEIDKEFAPAHKKLGHVLHAGRWLTYDEQRAAQGLVKYKGRWISRQEKEQIDAREALAAEQVSWARRLKILRSSVLNGTDEQRNLAEGQLVAIRDPAAVSPLVQAFGNDPPSVRTLLDQVLGGIPGRESAAALVARVFAESDPTVRQATIDELARRRDPDTITRFTQALRSADPEVVGRAAWALAALNEVASIPKLIPALMRIERKVVMVPSGPTQNPGGIGVGFSSAAPTPAPSGHAAPGVGNVSSYPVLTGPVVAPGVAAYGVTSVPYATNGTTLSNGMGGSRPVPELVTITHENPEVLAALQKLTGQDFGYDISSWRRWLQSAPRRKEPPARRVPQP